MDNQVKQLQAEVDDLAMTCDELYEAMHEAIYSEKGVIPESARPFLELINYIPIRLYCNSHTMSFNLYINDYIRLSKDIDLVLNFDGALTTYNQIQNGVKVCVVSKSPNARPFIWFKLGEYMSKDYDLIELKRFFVNKLKQQTTRI